MHHLAYHSFDSESHKFFFLFPKKVTPIFKSGQTFSTNSRTRHLGKYKEEDGFSWTRESGTQRRDGNHAGEDRRDGGHADSGGWIVWIGKNAESCTESTPTICASTICALVHAPHCWWNTLPCCLWTSDAYFSTYNSCSAACCNALSSYFDLSSTCDSHCPTKWRTHFPLREYRGL